MKKILFIDSAHNILKEEFEKMGFECDYFQDISKQETEKIISNYKGVIIRSRFKFDREIIDKAKNLIFIGRVGSGLESIDVKYAESKGIICLNSPEGNRDAVGEHTLGLLLNLLHKISKANTEVKKGIWLREENRGEELKGKTVGIIGYGNMGSSFAKKLKGFDAKVIAYDKYKSNYSDENVTEATLTNLFNETDILSMHVPLTDETEYMVDDKFINSFHKKIYLLNTSRGKVVKTSDLVHNLKAGKIKGAGLDVMEFEDTSFEKVEIINNDTETFRFLKEAKNVILTPHVAGWTHESKLQLSVVLADKINKLFNDIK